MKPLPSETTLCHFSQQVRPDKRELKTRGEQKPKAKIRVLSYKESGKKDSGQKTFSAMTKAEMLIAPFLLRAISNVFGAALVI